MAIAASWRPSSARNVGAAGVLRCRDLVGFLGDIGMGKCQGRVRGEGAQDLGGGAVVEVVEAAAQRFAIERDAGLAGLCAYRPKPGGMLANDRLDLCGIKPLEDVADRGVSRRAAPLRTDGRVHAAMNIDEGGDASGAARIARSLLASGDESAAFLRAKIATVRFYAEHILPAGRV